MTSFIRRHLSYANVVATMALVLAMGGSALAAGKEFTAEAKSKEFSYVISSIDQINPRVQAELKATEKAGHAGLAGPAGATGTAGAVGSPGPEGSAGLPGAAGAPGIEGVQGKEGAEGKPGEQGARGEKGETGSRGEKGEAGLSVLSKSEQETLKSILPYVKYVAAGVGGKPTIQISGANVQIVHGELSTEP